MSHEYIEEIICPYCDLKAKEDHEYIEEDCDIECNHCDSSFGLVVHTKITYSTYRQNCKHDKHEYGEPEIRIIDQKTCDRWNQDKVMNFKFHKPHKTIIRQCNNCEDKDYNEEEINIDN